MPGYTPRLLVFDTANSDAAPDSTTRSVTCLPTNGSCNTRCESITWPTPVDCVSISAALASTWTDSVTEPTLSVTSTSGLVATCRTIPVCTYLEKPVFETSSWYGPT